MWNDDLEALEFAAFRFIAGEMEPSEAAAFERQLSEDQLAREAVCRAVSVTEKLVLAGTRSEAPTRSGRMLSPLPASRFGRVSSAISWMTVGAIVASVVFMFAGWSSRQRDQRLVDDTPPGQLTPAVSPRPPMDPMLVDGLVWSQISETTRWKDEVDWIGEASRRDVMLPQLDLLLAPTNSMFDIYHEPGEIR